MRTDSSQVNDAPPLVTAILRADKAPVVERIWSALPWLQLQLYTATLSISDNSPDASLNQSQQKYITVLNTLIMQKFTVHKGLVAPMDRENVDTDAIIPKQFLKSIRKTGFGVNLFDAWRYLDPGFPGQDPLSRKPNPDFVLNFPRYKGASILLARKNFGCGSSREHAPWALDQYGFRCILAPSYADIFFNNSFKNGLLPIILSEQVIDQLFHESAAFPGFQLTIDLQEQVIIKDQGEAIKFSVEPFRRYCLLNGFDDIGLTLRHADKIRAFEAERLSTKPWLAQTMIEGVAK